MTPASLATPPGCGMGRPPVAAIEAILQIVIQDEIRYEIVIGLHTADESAVFLRGAEPGHGQPL